MKQRKALVVGGSRGIGAAVTRELLRRGYDTVYVADRTPPDAPLAGAVKYCKTDLAKDDLRVLDTFDDIDTLVITAGIGRLSLFDTFPDAEIQKTFLINTLAVVRIIKKLYHRMRSRSDFQCLVVSSIAGVVSSPFFAVYGATKAAVFRFIESINIELEKAGTANRILNVCPGIIPGTSFYGAATDTAALKDLARVIADRMAARETLFIPGYEETYKEVIQRYHIDARKFGLESYDYKKDCGRVNNRSFIKTGYMSGTFDLFHIGHLNIIRRAKEYCDYLVVGVHRDAAHKNKTVFIPFEERCAIVKSLRYVDEVIESKPEDSDVYHDIHYDYLFVGSDYQGSERFKRYEEFFKGRDVKIVYFPYTQGTSSTQIRELIERTTVGMEQAGGHKT